MKEDCSCTLSFSDLTAAKLRPALVIHWKEKKMLIFFISSNVPFNPSKTDIIISRNHDGFKESGLKFGFIYNAG